MRHSETTFFSGELDAEKIVEYGLIFIILIKKKNIERRFWAREVPLWKTIL